MRVGRARLSLGTIMLCSLLACRLDDEWPTEPSGIMSRPSTASVVTADTLEPVADAHIKSFAPNNNYGAADSLVIRAFSASNSRFSAYINFNVAAIEAALGTGQLDSAKLELYLWDSGSWPSGGGYIDAYRIPNSWAPNGWTENGITANCPNDTNTSNSALNCPGGLWDTTGFGAMTATDQVLVTNPLRGWVSFDVAADVSAWLGGAANHGWHIARENATTNGRAVFWSREGTYKPHLILYMSGGSGIPAVPADTMPSWTLHDTSYTTDAPGYLKHTIGVAFHGGATQQQREAAIASVEGTVIGGWNPAGSTEGLYAVQVSDTTSVEGLRANRLALRSLPQVQAAIYFPLAEANYLRPHDGPNWQKAQWSLTPDNVPNTQRWALEAIEGPAAWGCSTGEQDANVIVADINFDNIAEVVANLRTPLPAFGQRPDLVRHGTGMTSTIAARGNDSAGMTGVMWNAKVLALEVPVSDSGNIITLPALGAVLGVVDGSDTAIVNLSWGSRWDSLPTQQDSIEHARAWAYVGHYFTNIQPMSPNALLVIAAGNQGSTGSQRQDSLDAWWSGLPILADYMPGHVLVVGSSTISQTRAKFSSLGTRPHIYAPGKDVYSYNGSALTITADSGDSYANAYVTGVAGLLKSFDPRLTGPQIRNLILEGADSGGRVITNGKKLLNAHESLKAAARRTGAPLCGNRTYLQGNSVYATREQGQGDEQLGVISAAVSDSLFGSQVLGHLAVEHGGKTVSGCRPQNGGSCLNVLIYQSGSWSPDPTGGGWRGSNSAAFLSSIGRTHDADSVAVWSWVGQPGSGVYDLSLKDIATNQSKYIGRLTSNRPSSLHAQIVVSPSPTGEFLLIAEKTSDLIGCCTGVPTGAYYTMRTADGAVDSVMTIAQRDIHANQVLEGGLLGVISVQDYLTDPQGWIPTGCTFLYVTLPGGQVQQTVTSSHPSCLGPRATLLRPPQVNTH